METEYFWRGLGQQFDLLPVQVATRHVPDGATVAAGQALLSVEFEKMGAELAAPVAGVVRFHVSAGQSIHTGQLVVSIARTDDAAEWTTRHASYLVARPPRLTAEEFAERTRAIAAALREGDVFNPCGGYSESARVQRVVTGLWWEGRQDVLAPAQAEVIAALGTWLKDAGPCLYRRLACDLEARPLDYRRILDRIPGRQRAVRESAGQMVAWGLLTEPQAEYIMYAITQSRYIQNLRSFHADVWARIGLTDEEWESAVQVFRIAYGVNLDWGEARAAFRGALSPAQQATWDELSAERPVPPMPDLVKPAASELAKWNLADQSIVFQTLIDRTDELELNGEQREMLARLIGIVQTGLHWNALQGRSSEAFLRHAELLAIEGPLSTSRTMGVAISSRWA